MFMPSAPCYTCERQPRDVAHRQASSLEHLRVAREACRELFIAPVGNQAMFGVHNKARAPRVVIMGLTTSPTARGEFMRGLNRLRHQDLRTATKYACITNTFNSTPPTLLRVLSQICNAAHLWRIAGTGIKVAMDRCYNRHVQVDHRILNDDWLEFEKLVRRLASAEDAIA